MNKLRLFILILLAQLAIQSHALPVFSQDTAESKSGVESKSVGVFPALAAAQKKLKRATRDYEQLRRLVARGSGSNAALRRSLLVKQIAELQLAAIQKPGFAPDYARKGAQLKTEYARKEYEISKSLFQRGSVSKLRHQKKKNAYQIARIELAVAKGEIEEEKGDLKIAKFELQQAEFEFQNAKRLLERGSLLSLIHISEPTRPY